MTAKAAAIEIMDWYTYENAENTWTARHRDALLLAIWALMEQARYEAASEA